MSYSGKNFKVYEAKNLEIGDSILTVSGPKRIKSIKSAGEGNCYDISFLTDKNLFQNEPNFILANGIVSHNCNLPVIDDCINLIASNKGRIIKRKDVPIDDKESIRLGTRGELMGIFQFENPYTKKVADRVGVDSLADIAAITSLIRPGPKDVGLDMEYAERKNGKKYDRNPVLDKVLGNTYGVLTYQEQVQLLGIHMAGMTPLEANRLRKGASKKKKEIMDELKPKFIKGSIEKCVKTGLMTEAQVTEIWNLIESMASYSFNKCLSPETVVETDKRKKKLKNISIGEMIKVPDFTGKNRILYSKVIDIIPQGRQECFEFTSENGLKIICTNNHKFLCAYNGRYSVMKMGDIAFLGAELCMEDGSLQTIEKIVPLGEKETMDITVDSEEHLFFANGFVTSNSHAVAYSAITTTELWLRHHYFCEYMTALLQNADPAKEKFGASIFDKYVKFSLENGLIIHRPDINESRVGFRLIGQDAYYGLGHVKNVSNSASAIVKYQPYSDFDDFYSRCVTPFGNDGRMRRLNSRVVESLIYAGTFDRWGSREDIMKRFYVLTDRIESNKLPRVSADVKELLTVYDDEISIGDCGLEQVDDVILGKIRKTKALKDDESQLEPMTELHYDNSNKYIDFPVMSEKFLTGMEEEMLGASLSGNLAVKYREYTKGYDLYSFVRVRLEREKVKVRIMGKILQIKEINFQNGNNGIRVYLTDGTRDLNFLVFTSAINTFKDFYREGDVAIIPLKNFGAGCDDPTFRFFDDDGQGVIIERDGVIVCKKAKTV